MDVVHVHEGDHLSDLLGPQQLHRGLLVELAGERVAELVHPEHRKR